MHNVKFTKKIKMNSMIFLTREKILYEKLHLYNNTITCEDIIDEAIFDVSFI